MPAESIPFNCPKCGKSFKVPPEFLGKKITCKACQTGFVVPTAKPAAAATPPAATSATIPVASGSPRVAAATTAPAPVTPPPDDLAMIPFDDGLVTQATVATSATRVGDALATAGKEGQLDKVKLDIKGHYFVLKLYLASKGAQKDVERLLNEYAEDGWRLIQILQVGDSGFAIMFREPAARSSAAESDEPKA